MAGRSWRECGYAILLSGAAALTPRGAEAVRGCGREPAFPADAEDRAGAHDAQAQQQDGDARQGLAVLGGVDGQGEVAGLWQRLRGGAGVGRRLLGLDQVAVGVGRGQLRDDRAVLDAHDTEQPEWLRRLGQARGLDHHVEVAGGHVEQVVQVRHVVAVHGGALAHQAREVVEGHDVISRHQPQRPDVGAVLADRGEERVQVDLALAALVRRVVHLAHPKVRVGFQEHAPNRGGGGLGLRRVGGLIGRGRVGGRGIALHGGRVGRLHGRGRGGRGLGLRVGVAVRDEPDGEDGDQRGGQDGGQGAHGAHGALLSQVWPSRPILRPIAGRC